MWRSFRRAVSEALESLLRWLTASALRSTAIFVILTFVPILLLTYYIVATSIRNTKADAAAVDRQMRNFAVSLLSANLRGERDALVGASDESSLQTALTTARALMPPASTPAAGAAGGAGSVGAIAPLPPKPPPPPSAAQLNRLSAQRQRAQAALARLRHRRPEFVAIALYDARGIRQVSVPAGAGVTPVWAMPTLPEWFRAAASGQAVTSPVMRASGNLPRRIAFAVPIPFPLPAAAGHNATGTGVLVGLLPTSVVDSWVHNISVGPDRFVYVVDARRQVVSASPDGPFTAAQVASLPAVAGALAGRHGSGEFVTAIQLESHDISYAPLAGESMALLVVRPVRFGFYIYRVFYDKLAFIAVIIFLLAVATGLLLRSAFRYYQRYNREVESGRAKTEALLGSIGDGVFAVDGAGRVIEFNRAAADLTGQSAASALGRRYPEVIHLVEEHPNQGGPAPGPDPVQKAMQQGRTFRFLRDLTLVRRDATRLPVTVSAAPVRDDKGGVEGCIVVFSDASQEREVDRMKNEFISIASHQLRTPMSGVKGVLSLLLEEILGPLNAEQRQYLRRANESNERLIALVNDLLNVSRLEQGNLQLRSEPVDLGEMLQSLALEFQPRAARYQQQLRFTVGKAARAPEAAVVHGDPVRLREVFANLIDNAVKYTPEQGIISLRLGVAPAPGADRVVVEVSDSGVGIPADKLPSLFQKFSRIQNPLSGREFGTGLGLYFARSVVELHRGTIEVDSRPGEGTTFRVSLPRRAPEPLDGERTSADPAAVEP